MKSHFLKIASIQHACTPKYADNLQTTEELLERAAEAGAHLVLLPELHTRPYFCQEAHPSYFDWAEPIPGPSSEKLQQLAARLNLIIVGSIFEKRTTGVYHNTAVVLDRDGSFKGLYRKMHIPEDPGYYEKYYFTPGENTTQPGTAFTPITTSLGKLGVLICWDQWFPEAARLMALSGADILLYPTAIGWDPRDEANEQQKQLEAWQTIQKSHAIANHLPVIVANRCGFEENPSDTETGIQFWGHSFICGAQGEILAQTTDSQSTLICAEVDLIQTDTLRRIWPFFRDRRIDAYAGLSQRTINYTRHE